MVMPELSDDFYLVMKWANKYKKMSVRANAETPLDAKTAYDFGAEGIGLCRTEHMFFNIERISFVREMILAFDTKSRRVALEKLEEMQIKDFTEIFNIMHGLPINIRLLDPPLHEFLPHFEADIKKLSEQMNIPLEKLKLKIEQLKEQNPMIGHRGCRLGISYPEIYEMQANAIFKALKSCEINTNIEIMVPFIISTQELIILRKIIEKSAHEILGDDIGKYKYQVGTMIELPKACLIADKIANYADFFSFGTNDLTQTTLGLSRDDSATFLNNYLNNNIFNSDPFQTIDLEAVGKLIQIAVEKGRNTKKNLKIGICGEHGGDPASIEFFNSQNFDYISCSPFRVPVAIIAAAQSAIKEEQKLKHVIKEHILIA